MNEKIGKTLGNIAGKLNLYQFLSKIGVEAFFYRKVYADKIKDASIFYQENVKRVEKCANIFSDADSREIYKKDIMFRTTHYLKDRPQYCAETEYFNSLTTNWCGGVYLDCGAYSGDTIMECLRTFGSRITKIVAFEPDEDNYEKLKNTVADKENVTIFKAGVWSENTKLRFVSGELTGSRVDISNENTNSEIFVKSIDETPECADASFIKMDIEGSELKALEGARKTILRNRPILTICIYHTNEDMLSIPEWMADNLTDYKFYCRHHSYYIQDTIMYAIPAERV
jgi:FkbM family methyltransferase